jgi:protein O-GlcNAc transferase
LGVYGRIDVALDTFPYAGTTTTCESLWMGVPVVTLARTNHVSRVGASILKNTGLAQLIAQTTKQYLSLAADLAGDINRLKTMRANLRQMLAESPLMDAVGFTRELESSYRSICA